jgi:hypothetical protein
MVMIGTVLGVLNLWTLNQDCDPGVNRLSAGLKPGVALPVFGECPAIRCSMEWAAGFMRLCWKCIGEIMSRLSARACVAHFASVSTIAPVAPAAAKATDYRVMYAFSSSSSGGQNATVFMLSRKGKAKVLHVFSGNGDGATPYAGLVVDAAGNLYGTSTRGGADGREPECTLFPDAAGHLFGTTFHGGSNNAGTVFRITE